MGRKSIADIRKQEILDAYEACIHAYGYHQSSTRKIAEKAGVKQPMIAHYFNNKAALTEALVARVEEYYLQAAEKAMGDTEGEERISRSLDYIFGPEFLGQEAKERPLGQLLAAAKHDPILQSHLTKMYQTFLITAIGEMERTFPHVPKEKCKQTAYSILGLAVGNDLLVSVGLEYANREHARIAASILLDELNHEDERIEQSGT